MENQLQPQLQKNFKTFSVSFIILGCLILVAILLDIYVRFRHDANTTAHPTTPAHHTVTYSVSGTANDYNMFYLDSTYRFKKFDHANNSWTYSIRDPKPGEELIVSATVNSDTGNVITMLRLDNVLIDAESSNTPKGKKLSTGSSFTYGTK